MFFKGPREHLESFNIPVKNDLKVGHNLQDHIGLGGLTFIVDDPITFTKKRYQTLQIAMEYIMYEKGPMTSLGGIEGIYYIFFKFPLNYDTENICGHLKSLIVYFVCFINTEIVCQFFVWML